MENLEKRKAWEVNERIAAILEKWLVPNATVRHNVRLPVLGSPTRKMRQCDVVIEYGMVPRSSLTIVEVQKRKSKPSITMFHGWVEKMRQVGAQQLICVSEAGYPESIIEDVANKLGPTVKLMTLREIEQTQSLPLILLPGLIYRKPTFEIVHVGPINRDTSDDIDRMSIEIRSDDKVFSVDDFPETIDLNQLICAALGQRLQPIYDLDGPFNPAVYDVQIRLTQNEKEKIQLRLLDETVKFILIHIDTARQSVWLNYQNDKIRIREWQITLRITTQFERMDMSYEHFEYRQAEHDGVLAWVATAKSPFNNEEIQIIFKADENGLLQITGVTNRLS